jgi:Glycosyltransferase family 87
MTRRGCRTLIHTAAIRLHGAWNSHQRSILVTSTIVMATMASLMLVKLFRVLLVWPNGAIDLKYYYLWVQPWLHGADVYGRLERPEYPPASMILLWPLAGWLSLSASRSLMAVADAAALVGLTAWLVRASGVRSAWARAGVALLLLSMTPTGAAIGNGQLSLILLSLVVGAVTVFVDRPPSWPRDLAGAALVTMALVKPSVSVPFLCLGLVVQRPIRPLVIVMSAYAALTVFAASFQPTSVWTLLSTAVTNGQRTARMAVDGNVHFLLRAIQLPSLMLPVTAAIGLALAWWVWRHRLEERWLLLGVIGLVARLWTYHRIYDGVLVVLAEVALLRIACLRSDDDAGALAGGLLGLTTLVFLSPGPGANVPLTLDLTIQAIQGCVTAIDLAFLIYYSERGFRWSRVPATPSTVPASFTSPSRMNS